MYKIGSNFPPIGLPRIRPYSKTTVHVSLLSRHEPTQEISTQVEVGEVILHSYCVVTHSRGRDEINPVAVGRTLLERGWLERFWETAVLVRILGRFRYIV